mmetsp:Transcript_45083/g.72567  ORF Transcript_45083/g.72567 Transcript_45083/m.72567 type:complete len:247 (-) Transcript_45083:69-809(-)
MPAQRTQQDAAARDPDLDKLVVTTRDEAQTRPIKGEAIDRAEVSHDRGLILDALVNLRTPLLVPARTLLPGPETENFVGGTAQRHPRALQNCCRNHRAHCSIGQLTWITQKRAWKAQVPWLRTIPPGLSTNQGEALKMRRADLHISPACIIECARSRRAIPVGYASKDAHRVCFLLQFPCCFLAGRGPQRLDHQEHHLPLHILGTNRPRHRRASHIRLPCFDPMPLRLCQGSLVGGKGCVDPWLCR